MSSTLAAYISGHGFGHATRSSAVLEHLQSIRPDCRIIVCSEAPSIAFAPSLQVRRVCIEPSPVERTALCVDMEASGRAMDDFLRCAHDVVEREAAWVQTVGATLIYADVPFLAAEIAARSGIRAVAGGNFTWDWIFELHAGSDARSFMRRAYGKFDEALRFPLHHEAGWDVFPKVTDVPLVAPRSRRERSEIRAQLGLGDGQTAVLFAGRAGLSDAAIERVCRESPEFVFLAQQPSRAANVRVFRADDALPFSDVVRACDVAVSKLGYSIAAECIAEHRPLLYPERTGFREDEVMESAAARYLRLLRMSAEQYTDGDWSGSLRAVSRLPKPANSMRLDGAQVVAEYLSRCL